MKKLIVCSFFGLFSSVVFAQNLQIGPVMGNMWQYKEALVQVDSVTVNLQSGPDGRLVLGLWAEYRPEPWLGFRTTLTGVNNTLGITTLEPINDYCIFLPCRTSKAVGYFTFSATPSLTLSVPIGLKGRLFGYGGITINTHIVPQFERPNEPPATEGVDVIYEMLENRAVKPFTAAYTYGLGIEAWRFSVQAQVAQSIGSHGVLRDVTYQGAVYPSYSWTEYLTLMLVYQFDWPFRSQKNSQD